MKNLSPYQSKVKGFTLIELLVVIGILAVLLAIVLIAINPARQFSQANNTKRRSDVNALLNAVHQYMVDNRGTSPAGIDTTVKDVTSTAGATNIDLCAPLVTRYMADMPTDPQTGTRSYTTGDCTQVGATYGTGYTITRSAADNRITVAAPGAELGDNISVTR